MGRKLRILDNSGATEAKQIRIKGIKKEGQRDLRIGEVLVTRITKNISNAKFKKGEVIQGMVSTSREICVLRSLVLVKLKGDEYVPLATRMKGITSFKLRKREGTTRLQTLVKRTL